MHYSAFLFSKSGLFTWKIPRIKAGTLCELINNNGVLDMSVSYKFSSYTLLHIKKILYFLRGFNRSVWSFPLSPNVKFHHVLHRNRDCRKLEETSTKNATEKRQM